MNAVSDPDGSARSIQSLSGARIPWKSAPAEKRSNPCVPHQIGLKATTQSASTTTGRTNAYRAGTKTKSAARARESTAAATVIQSEPMWSCSDQNGSSMSVSVIAEVVRKRSNGIRSTTRADTAAATGARMRGRTAPRSIQASSAMTSSGAT